MTCEPRCTCHVQAIQNLLPRRLALQCLPTEDIFMPTMSNLRRKRIVAKQRKVKNAAKRTAKAAKRERNSAR
jgi:hypothetical protein